MACLLVLSSLLIVKIIHVTVHSIQHEILLPVTQPEVFEEFLQSTHVPEESRNIQSYEPRVPSITLLIQDTRTLPDVSKQPIYTQPQERKQLQTDARFTPLCDRFYKGADGDTNVTVIPRRAYYDGDKIWQPNGGNVVVVLAEVNDSALEDIKSCEVNGHYMVSMEQVRENTVWVRRRYPKSSYSLVIVKCLNVPSEALEQGSPVHLVYKQQTDDCYSRVESEHPLIVKPVKPSIVERGPNSVVICIPVFKRPLFLDGWLKYQKHIGIDMIHIAADPSFVANATIDYPYLGQALNSGFAKIEVWANPIGEERASYFSQLLKLQDCIMQYRGVFQYTFLIDSDEFFTPLIPTERKLEYYLQKLFYFKKIATICFRWVKYFCQPHPSRDTVTGNLTATLDNYGEVKVRSEEKCIHKIDGVVSVNVHSAKQLVPGYRTSQAGNFAYIAHFHPKKNC